MRKVLGFRIAVQTIRDYWKSTIIIALLFVGITFLYSGMFPSFEQSIIDMMDSSFYESFNFFAHADQMHTYVGFLTLELYNIFWLLILAIMLGFLAASSISKEIEGKTIDLLLSNPVSRWQLVAEKYLGLIPMFLVVNFSTMFAVIGITGLIGETINYSNLLLVHLVSIPYFLAVFAMGIVLSVLIDEKMKASIVLIAILVGMFVLNSLSLMTPEYEWIGSFSLLHYFDPYSVLQFGQVDGGGVLVFLGITAACLIGSMLYFERRDIAIS